jgi:hypothetical protein
MTNRFSSGGSDDNDDDADADVLLRRCAMRAAGALKRASAPAPSLDCPVVRFVVDGTPAEVVTTIQVVHAQENHQSFVPRWMEAPRAGNAWCTTRRGCQ